MKQPKRALRRAAAAIGSLLALWSAAAVSGTPCDAVSALDALSVRQLSLSLPSPLSPAEHFILRRSPWLTAAEAVMTAPDSHTTAAGTLPEQLPAPSAIPQIEPQPLAFLDNGVPAQTVQVSDPKSYTAVGGVYIKNSSGKTVDTAALTTAQLPAPGSGPQVLILHTHGSEAYTLPPGQSYVSTGSYRTADTSCSVVRVGDEIAATLSSYGISVLHDRTLYDDPLYNGAYARSEEGAAAYLEKYPSLYYILDIHRDAVEDSMHNQYKLVAAEDDTVAQLSFVIGTNHEQWQQNLALAVAVSAEVQKEYPTAMRPIILRSSRYNQHLSPGSLLLEVGAAGNSLDEALHASRIFADALAQVILSP